MSPLETYLAAGVGWLASSMSTQVKALQQLIVDAMAHPGFSIIHVQSPCTTYNDTYAALKGNEKEGIEPMAFPVPEDHDVTDIEAAYRLARGGRIPIGRLYERPDSVPAHERLRLAQERTGSQEKTVEELFAAMAI